MEENAEGDSFKCTLNSAIEDYCKYVKSESDSEVSAVEETIDNMMMRLEEFKGTLEMVKSERCDIESTYKNIVDIKRKVLDLTYRIDAMEVFISKVHQDMNTLETQLVEAEQDIPDRSRKLLKNLFKPIFSKINADYSGDSGSNAVGTSGTMLSSHEKVEVFSTSELFNQTNENSDSNN